MHVNPASNNNTSPIPSPKASNTIVFEMGDNLEEPDREQPRDKESRRDKSRERNRSRDRSHKRHHRSSHHKDQDRGKDKDEDLERQHRKKRSRHGGDHEDERRHRRRPRKKEERKSAKNTNESNDEDTGEWIEAPPLSTNTGGVEIPNTATNSETVVAPVLKRDSWMTEPAADFVDYTQKGAQKSAPQPITKPDYRPAIHKNELNTQLREGKSVSEYAQDTNNGVGYTFGDEGSKWRMIRLKRVYQAASEDGKSLEAVAIERYGDLKTFDEAREEEMELGRRDMYGKDRRDMKDKPTGDLYQERLKNVAARDKERQDKEEQEERDFGPAKVIETAPTPTPVKRLDQTALNRLKAAYLRAQIKNDPKAAELEEEYTEAVAAAAEAKPPAQEVVISAMDSRKLVGLEGRMGRTVVEGKRGKLVEMEDMTLENMVREEKRTRGTIAGGEGMLLAERIARDAKFSDNLDYLDENATRLAKHVQKNEIDLKNMAISEFKKMQRVLNTCPLCEQDDKPPIAPVISLGTRVFLTLQTEPELCSGGAIIVPIQHRVNMMECDDDEWEEVRNFMKALIRMYSDQGKDVIFYENAASPQRRKHAAIVAIPLPKELGGTAPAYFKEAIMSADEEWSQHKKIIDTLSRARKEGLGKMAFRRSLVKQMPYFHVWFEIDGGMGHIIEDENRWPKGDLFAREVLGGMLDAEPNVIRKQGRWVNGKDPREAEFKKGWEKFDWTKALCDA